MKQVKRMPRNKYQQHTKMTMMCRVCLTNSTNFMFKLQDDVDFHQEKETKKSYLEILEYVTSSRVILNGEFPENICPVCTSILKMSFQFIKQFNDSQIELKKRFNHTSNDDVNFEQMIKESEELASVPNVELIFQDNKFSINDLLVVENAETDDFDYKGFLNNLGEEVTATFVGTLKEKKLNEDSDGTDKISISVIDKDGILPVRELQIDDETNSIEVTLEDNPINDENEDFGGNEDENIVNEDNENIDEVDDLFSKVDEIINKKTSDPDTGTENIEYIEIDMMDQAVIDALIIDRSKSKGISSRHERISNSEPRRKNKRVKVGKRRKKTDDDCEKDEFDREIKFPCDICQNIFGTNKHLRAHKKRVHFRTEQTFACEICGYLCRTKSAFVHHKLKHEGKKFKCHLCDKAYTTKAVLKVHIGTHANKRQNLCNVCGKGFNYPNALVYHMRLHTGEKNYQCEYCDRTFRMPNSLNRHRRTHTGDRPYKCRYCGRAFCSNGEVTCHEYVHTGFRPYHCKYCRKGFSKTHNLKIHLLSHKGNHQCEICERSFIEPAILAMHYRISHKEYVVQDDGESTDSQRENGGGVKIKMDYTEYRQMTDEC